MSARIETLFGKDESGATYTFLPRTSTKAVMDESGNTADELITDLSQEVSELINDVEELSGKVETISGEVVNHGEKLSELDRKIEGKSERKYTFNDLTDGFYQIGSGGCNWRECKRVDNNRRRLCFC